MEDEIKVGEYVRNKEGKIIKATWVGQAIVTNDKFTMSKLSGEIVNIIDLIEKNDYVNGYKVLDVVEDMKTGELHLEMPMDYTNQELGDCTIYNKDIKLIITKEQIKQIEYRIKE